VWHCWICCRAIGRLQPNKKAALGKHACHLAGFSFWSRFRAFGAAQPFGLCHPPSPRPSLRQSASMVRCAAILTRSRAAPALRPPVAPLTRLSAERPGYVRRLNTHSKRVAALARTSSRIAAWTVSILRPFRSFRSSTRG